jgi:hypothetical protein
MRVDVFGATFLAPNWSEGCRDGGGEKARDRSMMSNRRRSVGGIRICAAGNIQSVHVPLGLENDLRHRLGHNHPMGLAARIQTGSWQGGHVTIVFQEIIVLQEDP